MAKKGVPTRLAKAKGVPTELLLGAAAVGGAFLLLKGVSGGGGGNGGGGNDGNSDILPGPVQQGDVTITDVVVRAADISLRYNGVQLIPINISQKVTADITWKNVSNKPLRPIFRLDAKSSTRMTWREGPEKPTPSSAMPGASATVTAEISLPSDWLDGTVELKVQAIGPESPAWPARRMLEYVQEITNFTIAYSATGNVLPGDNIVTLRFTHRGQGFSAFCGVGLVYSRAAGYNAPFAYYNTPITVVGDLTPHEYAVSFMVTIPNMSGSLDVLRFMSLSRAINNQQVPDDFGVNDWDDDVWSVSGTHSYSTLYASYNEQPIGTQYINLYDGDSITVRMTFVHKGPATTIVVAAGLNWNGTPFWIQGTATLGADVTEHTYVVLIGRPFMSPNGTVPIGNWVDVMKCLQAQGQPLNLNGEGMLLADVDNRVFVYRGARSPHASRWSVSDRPGAGITIYDVQLSGAQYVYWITYDEMPGQVYGPMTEAEVLAQIG